MAVHIVQGNWQYQGIMTLQPYIRNLQESGIQQRIKNIHLPISQNQTKKSGGDALSVDMNGLLLFIVELVEGLVLVVQVM